MSKRVDLDKLRDVLQDALAEFPEETAQMSSQDMLLKQQFLRLLGKVLSRLGKLKHGRMS